MDGVISAGCAVEFTDCALGCLLGVCCTDNFAKLSNGILLLKHSRDNRPRAHKVNQRFKELFILVHGIETLCIIARHAPHSQRHDAEASIYKVLQNLGVVISFYRIGFNHCEGQISHNS